MSPSPKAVAEVVIVSVPESLVSVMSASPSMGEPSAPVDTVVKDISPPPDWSKVMFAPSKVVRVATTTLLP